MDDFNKLLLEKNNGKRKQSSLDQISNNIRRLYTKCYASDPEDISQIQGMIEDYDHTFGCLQSDWDDGKKLGLSTMLSYTNALLIANDLFELDLSGTYGELETELQVRREDEKRKNPVKDTKISREQLDGILADLKQKAKGGGIRHYAIFQIIAKYPFRLESATLERISQSDFDSLSEEDKGIRNFLIQEENYMKFVFLGYKTNKKFGSREIQIDDDELRETLTQHLDLQSWEENDYVFFEPHKGDVTLEKSQEKQRNNLSVWVKRLLKKYGVDASATDVTKLLITEIWDDGTTQDKIRFAMWRGHHVHTAANVYATSL